MTPCIPNNVSKSRTLRGESYNLDNLTTKDIDNLIEDCLSKRIDFNLGLIAYQQTMDLIFSMFKCHRCGRCCSEIKIGDQGLRLSNIKELKSIAEYLNLSNKSIKKLCFTKNGFYYLPFPCHYFDEKNNGCKIYPVRPTFCRIFPMQAPVFINYNHSEQGQAAQHFGSGLVVTI